MTFNKYLPRWIFLLSNGGLLISILITTCCLTNAQTKVDSLLHVLKVAKHDTTKVNILNSLSLKLIRSEPDKSINYGKKALELAKKLKFKKGIASSYNNIGEIHRLQGNYPKSLEYFQKSLKIKEELGNRKGMSESYNNIGVIHWNLCNYPKSLEYFQKSLKIKEELGDRKGMSESYNNIGEIHRLQGNYPKALEYFQKSLKIKEELGKRSEDPDEIGRAKKGMSSSYNNIGLIHWNQGNYPKALEYYQKSLKIFEELGTSSDEALAKSGRKGMSYCYGNIGIIHYEQGNYPKALEYGQKSLKIIEELGDRHGIATSLGNIARLNIKLKNYTKAIDEANKSLNIAKEIGALLDERYAYKNLFTAYDSLMNYKKAYYFHKLYKQANDSLFNEEKNEKLTEMETRYETEKKEQQIKLLNKDKKLQKTQLDKQKLIIWSGAGGLLLVITLAFFIYRGYRQKQKANKLLTEQKAEIEQKNFSLQQANEEIMQQKEEITIQRDKLDETNKELEIAFKKSSRQQVEIQKNLAQITEQKEDIEQKNEDITDSINYAVRIQQAILPSEDFIKEILGEHFILFKPKDIVSGDFYWAAKIKNRLIVAAVDCSGHGVPGAFMSMLGVSFLNEIVRKEEITQPNQVLNELRENIIRSLQQKGIEGEAKDGMDMALIVIDTENLKLQYAGANNPLYIIRNNEKSPLIKGGALAGGSQGDVSPKTTNLPELISLDKSSSSLSANHTHNLSGFGEPDSVSNEKHILYEVKGDKIPIGIHEEMKEFTNNELQLQKGDTLYLFSDGYPDQFGGEKGKKFKYKPFKELFLSIQTQTMEKQKVILNKTFEDWKGNFEQIDDVVVIGIRI